MTTYLCQCGAIHNTADDSVPCHRLVRIVDAACADEPIVQRDVKPENMHLEIDAHFTSTEVLDAVRERQQIIDHQWALAVPIIDALRKENAKLRAALIEALDEWDAWQRESGARYRSPRIAELRKLVQ